MTQRKKVDSTTSYVINIKPKQNMSFAKLIFVRGRMVVLLCAFFAVPAVFVRATLS